MIGKISILFWITSIMGIITLQPKLELPLMHYQLLMLLHSLLLGVVLVPLLKDLSPAGSFEKISWTFINAGIVVLLLGFLIAPRTALIKNGGFFITTGVILSVLNHLRSPSSLIFWPSIALIETCLLGDQLGNSLNRISVDPIPFSALSAHAVTGLFLALTPMIFLSRQRKEGINSKKSSTNISAVFFASGVLVSLYIYQLPTPSKNPILLIFILSTWGITLLNKKTNKILPTVFSLTIFLFICFSHYIHFEGSIIGLMFFGWSLLLTILVWRPSTNFQMFWGVTGSIVILAGLLIQNYLLTLCGGIIQLVFILKISSSKLIKA